MDYQKPWDTNTQSNPTNKYKKKLFEVYRGISIFIEEDTGFYQANLNGKEYDTTSRDYIKSDIDDYIEGIPIGTSNKKRIAELHADKAKKYQSTYKYTKPDEMKSNMEILFICYLYVQGFTYFLSIPKWFLSLSVDTNFWYGFKNLIKALLPLFNIYYASDWFFKIFNFIGVIFTIVISIFEKIFDYF